MHTYVVLAYKQSKYLEECIKSVLNQKFPSKVIIATSTRKQIYRMI
ncbi:MAG: glycosyltransferase family A protein [Thomasclavelia sp.]